MVADHSTESDTSDPALPVDPGAPANDAGGAPSVVAIPAETGDGEAVEELTADEPATEANGEVEVVEALSEGADVDGVVPGEGAADSEQLEEFANQGEAEVIEKAWYILKVQVNREDTIRDALLRRVKIEALEPYFGEIVVPTEEVAEFNKSGKRRVVRRSSIPATSLSTWRSMTTLGFSFARRRE